MIEPVAPGQFAAIRPQIEQIDAAATAADGFSSLGDAARRDLTRPDHRSVGYLAPVGAYGHGWPIRSELTDGRWEVAVTVAPAARTEGVRVAVLQALLARIAAAAGERIVWWAPGADNASDGDANEVGLTADRELLRMEAPLPRPEVPAVPADVTLRAFAPGSDDAAWLALNNAAFRGHPEQGDWDSEMLVARCAEPWFDPALFVVAESRDGLVGFNWVRRHPGGEAEIYVIAVDRSRRGSGLGRDLALAGLDAAARTGSSRASLYCAADNDDAHRLYSRLGFAVTRIDRAYATEVGSR